MKAHLAPVIRLLRFEVADAEQHAEVEPQRREGIRVGQRHFEGGWSLNTVSKINRKRHGPLPYASSSRRSAVSICASRMARMASASSCFFSSVSSAVSTNRRPSASF